MIKTALVFFFLFSLATHAISIRHDKVGENRASHAESVSTVDLFGNDCMATLIAPKFLITVAHCAEDLYVGKRLKIRGKRYRIRAISDPGWEDATDKNDIALIKLNKTVSGMRPVQLCRQTSHVGDVITIIGRGVHSTGLAGEDGGDADGTFRKATNQIDAVTDDFYVVGFDRPGSPSVTSLEGVGLAGDSGGPVYVGDASDRCLAGLNSNGGCPFDDEKVGLYGCYDRQTRIAKHLDWIDQLIR